jgi:hypothetical protein
MSSSVSSLPNLTPLSVDQLESLRKAVVASRDGYFDCGHISTFVVALGCFLELPEVSHDSNSVFKWARARLKKKQREPHPDLHPLLKLVVIFGWFLIVAGLMGEFRAETVVNILDGNIQTINDRILEITGNTAKAISFRLDAASKQLGIIEDLTRAQGPRWRLLRGHKEELVDALKPFHPKKVIVVVCGNNAMSTEVLGTLAFFRDLFGKDGVNWQMTEQGWPRCATDPAEFFGTDGILVLTSTLADKGTTDAANTLSETLHNIHISNSHFQPNGDPQGAAKMAFIFGADSAMYLSATRPDALVLLLFENPERTQEELMAGHRAAKPAK